MVEGRGLPEGNTASETRPGRSAGQGVSSDLDRVRQVARKDRDVRFTALLHHVERRSFAGGVSGDQPERRRRGSTGSRGGTTGWISKRTFGICTPGSIGARIGRGPSRRVFIPKPDGRLRPLGVAALEDKILQRAVVEVLNAIYELGRAGARCRRCRRSVSPTRPPNRTCPFLSIRLSTGHAMVDRDAGFMQRRFPVERWLVLCRWPSTARGSGGRDSGIG